MCPGFVQRRTLHWHSWQAQEEDRRTVTKEMIEQLRETGMNWRSIATSYMPWNLRANTTQTLERVRGQVENNFTDITILPQNGRRLMMAAMELIISWTLWQSWKVSLTRNEKQCLHSSQKNCQPSCDGNRSSRTYDHCYLSQIMN